MDERPIITAAKLLTTLVQSLCDDIAKIKEQIKALQVEQERMAQELFEIKNQE